MCPPDAGPIEELMAALKSYSHILVYQTIGELEGLDPERYALPLVVALGKPKEDVRIVDAQDGSTRYYRDADGVHYVPKLPLDVLIV